MEHEIRDLNEKKIGDPYAPQRPNLEKLAKEIQQDFPKPAYTYNSKDAIINEIKESIKKLTHRQMRDMCKAIFEAKTKLERDETSDTEITPSQLPDVLDRWAHGD